jgi:hypothetical protein
MRTLKLLFGTVLIGTMLSSCYTDVIIEEDYIEAPVFNVEATLQSHELWYVDINATRGNGEVPFLQRAFTISFDRGTVYANNNIAGIGKNGNGFGVDVGYYDALPGTVEIDHDIDGLWLLEVYLVNNNTIELYDSRSDTSYFLRGYQRSNFDYDMLFYDNMQYLLQEYTVWEKVYTSQQGAINEFDNENYLQFLNGTQGNFFRSSIDQLGTPANSIVWDYEGDYEVYDVANDATLKTLTLDYDFMGNDYFELYAINDSTIELYHPDSGTIYEFKGRGYIQYLKSGNTQETKKRQKTTNPVMNVKRLRKS